MEANVKPGTRCECRVRIRKDHEYRCGGPHHNTDDECKNEAVRMVTVRERFRVQVVGPIGHHEPEYRWHEIAAETPALACSEAVTLNCGLGGLGPVQVVSCEPVTFPACAPCASYHEARQKERA